MVVIVMGVSGCGKSTIGALLGQRLRIPFYDADDFHPVYNVEKMRQGIPLNDEDRRPWLEALAKKIAEWQKSGGAVLACSALKENYRRILRSGADRCVQFVFLSGTPDLIRERMLMRKGHYMPTNLLESQFAALEEPLDAVTVGIDKTPEAICEDILQEIRR